MKIAAYPGSFDPITFGHIDILERVAPIFDKVVVLVSHSESKNYLFSTEERVEMVKQSLSHISNVSVEANSGLTVEAVKACKAEVIIRGIRAVADFEHEMAMAQINKKLSPGLETMVFFSDPEKACISSKFVKEIAKNKGDISLFVPTNIAISVAKKY